MTRLLPVLLLAACIDPNRPLTEGEQGELQFVDLTQHADGGFNTAGLGWPVAVGAEVNVGVYGWAEEDGQISAEIASGEGFEVVRDVGASVRLRAVGEGTSRIHVVTDDGREDTFPVSASPLGAVELVRNGDADLFGLMMPPSLEDVGEAFLPGANAGLAALLFGAGEQRLTGELALPWVVAPEVTVTPFDQIANGAWFSASFGGTYTVDAGFGTAWTLDFLAADAPVTLKLYESSYDPLVELTSITGPSGMILVGAGLFDADGRLVRTPDDLNVELELLDGPPGLLTNPGYSPVLLGFSALACPGSGHVRVHLAQGSVDVPVEITGEPAADCAP